MKKQPEITDRTRKVLVEVFCDLYTQKPIEKISVQEITNKAGYNRSTFYQYFCDIYELLSYIENDVLNYMRKKLNRQSETIQYSDNSIISLFEEKEMLLRALLGKYGSMRFVELIKKEISSNIQTLNAYKDDKLSPYIMEFRVSTSISLFMLWQSRQKDLQIDELLNLIYSLYTTGITPFIKEKSN
jgi:AcrR family transcriptional regulator